MSTVIDTELAAQGEKFAPNLAEFMGRDISGFKTPSGHLIAALKRAVPGVRTGGGFRKRVREEITRAVIAESDPNVVARLTRRFGRRRMEAALNKYDETHEIWSHDSYKINPDAYLVDTDSALVVAYEVEDTHPLSPSHVTRYWEMADSLGDLEIDFMLVVYDIYGHGRVFDLVRANVVAHDLLKAKKVQRESKKRERDSERD